MFSRSLLAVSSLLAVVVANPINHLVSKSEDAGVLLTLCIDPNYQDCLAIPISTAECKSLTGGLSGYNKEVSSVKIPDGIFCTFYLNFGCYSDPESVTRDSVVLQGGQYNFFGDLPGDGEVAEFDNVVSSFECSTF